MFRIYIYIYMVRYYGRARQRIGSVNTNQPALKQAGCPPTVGKQGLIIQHLGKRVNCNLKTCGLPMSGLRCRYGVADAIGRNKTFMDIQNSNNPAIKDYCKQVVGGQNGIYCQWPQPRNRQNAGGVGNIWTSRRNHCEKTCSLGWKEKYENFNICSKQEVTKFTKTWLQNAFITNQKASGGPSPANPSYELILKNLSTAKEFNTAIALLGSGPIPPTSGSTALRITDTSLEVDANNKLTMQNHQLHLGVSLEWYYLVGHATDGATLVLLLEVRSADIGNTRLPCAYMVESIIVVTDSAGKVVSQSISHVANPSNGTNNIIDSDGSSIIRNTNGTWTLKVNTNNITVDVTLQPGNVLLQGGKGIIGDVEGGTGNGYYSYPRATAVKGSTFNGHSMTGMPWWLDHQWSSNGTALVKKKQQEIELMYKLGLFKVRAPNFGFGVVAFETWIGVNLNDGASFCIPLVGLTSWTTHSIVTPNPITNFQFLLANGTQQSGEIQIVIEEMENNIPKVISIQISSPRTLSLKLSPTFNHLQQLTWASGANFCETPVTVTDTTTGKTVGYGFVENVGWNFSTSLKQMAAVLGITDASVIAMLEARPKC